MPSLFFIKIRSTLFKVDFNLYNKYMKTTETPLNCHRIVSVDFFRGLAILGVVLTHCLIYGVFYSTANALATVPIGLLAVLSPIVLISPMAGLFAFISVTANTFTALRRFENGSSAKNVIQPLLLTSTVLIVFHFVFSLLLKNSSASMFDPNETLDTLIPASIRQSEWIFPKFENLLFMDALAMIAISGFTAAAVIAILLKRKPPRERVLRILAIIGFTSAVLSPYIWYLFWIPFEYFYHAEGAETFVHSALVFCRSNALPAGNFSFYYFRIVVRGSASLQTDLCRSATKNPSACARFPHPPDCFCRRQITLYAGTRNGSRRLF